MQAILDNTQEAKLLGKQIDYPKSYCPKILVAVPRNLNREIYGIEKGEELFCGFDSWHAYEASFILDNGMPVAGILKIVYPASTTSIVESKSLKLYFGSYNMTTLGANQEIAIKNFTERVEKDLSTLLAAAVKACFYTNPPQDRPFDFNEYQIIEEHIDSNLIEFNIYQEHLAYLSENIYQTGGEIKIGSHLLKSNCKITNQPDWGTIYIHIKANTLPDKASILKYIVSLRNENHFHEEICEMVYKRLSDIFNPEILVVSCLYTRRGGIDICPTRANNSNYLPTYLPQENILTQSSFRQ